MPNFRRTYIPNALVFITGVTHHRTPYRESKANLDLFGRLCDVSEQSTPSISSLTASYPTIATG